MSTPLEFAEIAQKAGELELSLECIRLHRAGDEHLDCDGDCFMVEAKCYSQAGNFGQAAGIYEMRGSRGLEVLHMDSTRTSTLWRSSFLASMNNEGSQAKALAAAHLERVSPEGFQAANNHLYTQLADLARGDRDRLSVHLSMTAALEQAYVTYATSTIEFEGRVGNRVKSICQPLIADAISLWTLGNRFSAAVCAWSALLMLRAISLTARSEGVGEVASLAKKIAPPIWEILNSNPSSSREQWSEELVLGQAAADELLSRALAEDSGDLANSLVRFGLLAAGTSLHSNANVFQGSHIFSIAARESGEVSVSSELKNTARSLPLVLIHVATEVEFRALLRAMDTAGYSPPIAKVFPHGACVSRESNGVEVLVSKSEKGSDSPTGSQSVVESVLSALHPDLIIMPGIAFGRSQPLSTILVATHIVPYESERVGTASDGSVNVELRGDPMPARAWTLELARVYFEVEGREFRRQFGHLLSGEKLVDNPEFKAALLEKHKLAIGGEMEGVGVATAGDRRETPWLIAKAVCDYGDGKKSVNKANRQRSAARASCEFAIQFVAFLGRTWADVRPKL